MPNLTANGDEYTIYTSAAHFQDYPVTARLEGGAATAVSSGWQISTQPHMIGTQRHIRPAVLR